ncbi:CpXC domain-containing protein [Methanocorpusculum sp.]|nr:CpXC domain-containing protein [Methanocorpusculum sp.]MBO5367166.1 CpXC domain-containing protein [Methanocorpusculum sp.]
MNFEDDIEDAIICPNCNHEQELHVTPTVNVTVDPDMKEKVLSGELFLFTCENCGFSGYAGFPFIYEDKETNGGFLIYMEPGCEDREVGVDGDVADQVLLQNMTMRLVTTINELKEKIFIFEAGLDDRVVELFKMLSLSKMKADEASQIPDELRFSKMDTVDGEEKIFFAAFADEYYLGVLELPYALYQSCLITGEPIWDYPVNECGAVDQQWIMDRLQSGVTRDAEPECDCGCDGNCDSCGN